MGKASQLRRMFQLLVVCRPKSATLASLQILHLPGCVQMRRNLYGKAKRQASQTSWTGRLSWIHWAWSLYHHALPTGKLLVQSWLLAGIFDWLVQFPQAQLTASDYDNAFGNGHMIFAKTLKKNIVLSLYSTRFLEQSWNFLPRTIDLGWRLSSCEWWGSVCASAMALGYVERRLKNADRVEITWLRQLRTPERVDVSELFLRSNYLRYGGHFLHLGEMKHLCLLFLEGTIVQLSWGNSLIHPKGPTWTCKMIVKHLAPYSAFKWLQRSMALDCESVFMSCSCGPATTSACTLTSMLLCRHYPRPAEWQNSLQQNV